MNQKNVIEDLQSLAFQLGEEVFAFDIGQIREVLEYTSLTAIPRMPESMRGVINLRGHVVPVVDLRLKFGMPAAERTVNTCIIILEIEIAGETLVLGGLVDSVKEVITLDHSQIEPPPRMGTNVHTDFIRGMGKQGDGFIIILNANRVFSEVELIELRQETSFAEAVA